MRSNAQAITESELAKHGLKLSDVGEGAVLPFLDQSLRVAHSDTGKLTVTIVTEEGSEVAPDVFFADWTARYPGYFASVRQTPPAPAQKPTTMTGRMMATIAASRTDDGKASRAAEIASAGNPWAKGSWNFTRQGLVSNLDPDLASRLKRQAGVAA
jgi:hypothetical protein